MSAHPPVLVACALPEMRDDEAPLVLLHEGCRAPGESGQPADRPVRIIQSPWDSPEALRRAAETASDAYRQLLPRIAECMNDLNGVRRSIRYWEILIGPWLRSFCIVVLDRITRLRKANAEVAHLSVHPLDTKDFEIHGDTLQYTLALFGDHYNWQLATEMAQFLGIRTIEPRRAQAANPRRAHDESAAKRLVRALANTFAKHRGASVVLYNSYFSLDQQIWLALTTALRVAPMFSEPYEPPTDVPPDRDRRARMGRTMAVIGSEGYLGVLGALIARHLPTTFLEGYKPLTESVARFPESPAAIVTANSYFYDEPFKHWCAAMAERNVRLLGCQHGGNYGIAQHIYFLEHEIAVSDRYYSWGWQAETEPKVVPMPATKLRRLACSRTRLPVRDILFVTTAEPRFTVNFMLCSQPASFERYLHNQLSFIDRLPLGCRQAVRVRLYRDDFGWGIRERWRRQAPDIPIEGWELSLRESLCLARIYVCDHLSTTFVEALAADVPSILIFSAECNDVDAEALPRLSLLRKAGVLHDTPHSAAEALGVANADAERWWREPARRSLVKEFCAHHARTSPTALQEWRAELLTNARAG